jgi:DNA gyrase subunit B
MPPLWARHANAGQVEKYMARPMRKKPAYLSISDDLIGLPVKSAGEIPLSGTHVYDFSVPGDENFICGPAASAPTTPTRTWTERTSVPSC